MKTGSSFSKSIEETEAIVKALKAEDSLSERVRHLKNHPVSSAFFKAQTTLKALFSKLPLDEQEILFTLTALGQGEAVFSDWNHFSDPLPELREVATALMPLKKHYHIIGGIAGYQLETLKLLENKKSAPQKKLRFTSPSGLKLEDKNPEVQKLVKAGIESLPDFAVLYPVGGAGDRLDLYDETGKTPLPQAKLKFHGVPLLEGMIQDLIAREHLYFNLFKKELLTPVVMMTSPEKKNRHHIEAILEENKWFHRPKELFFLFDQPLVPMMSDQGKIATKGPLTLNLKPGGHGIIWELMETYGAFTWLENLKKDKLLIRQINNPIAGIDKNLLALAGKGSLENKAFGFLSCERIAGTSEGMNAIVEEVKEDGILTTLTNIEYTEFAAQGLKDEPESDESPYSAFPANTNILFAKIPEIRKALKSLPLPGLIINLKGQVTCYDSKGKRESSKGGRLETTMQNIADEMGTFSKKGPIPIEKLKTFILYNDRDKTISVTKKKWVPGNSVEETPQGAFEDRQKLFRKLFVDHLDYQIPKLNGHHSPNFILDFHPALGPLWDIIAQKVQSGTLAQGSDLILNVEKLYLKNLKLDGAFHIKSPSLRGSVFLKNITVKNRGMDKEPPQDFWKGDLIYKEKLEIILHGTGEFIADGVQFDGPLTFEVPDGHRMIVKSDKGKLKSSLEKVLKPLWEWDYNFNSKASCALTFKCESGTLSP
ncbi:MAG: UTP--glucose-1-phosphate uridylyltransferase [Chlamydiia bacterium]|nr:UTP--glucose-1-phosphate uridylyltransferase [Chlamydiia bacterium]